MYVVVLGIAILQSVARSHTDRRGFFSRILYSYLRRKAQEKSSENTTYVLYVHIIPATTRVPRRKRTRNAQTRGRISTGMVHVAPSLHQKKTDVYSIMTYVPTVRGCALLYGNRIQNGQHIVGRGLASSVITEYGRHEGILLASPVVCISRKGFRKKRSDIAETLKVVAYHVHSALNIVKEYTYDTYDTPIFLDNYWRENHKNDKKKCIPV